MAKVLSGVGFSRDPYSFTDEDFARIEKSLKVESLDDGQRQRLQDICVSYCLLSVSWKLAPRSKKIRHWLKKVGTDARKLDETLLALHDENEDDGPARSAAIEFLRSMAPPGNDWGVTLFDVLKLERQVCALSNTALKAQDRLLKDKGGNPGDMPLKGLVEDLATFYTEVTGERPTITFDDLTDRYTGHFLGLIESFLEPLGDYAYSQRSHQGLAKFIARALSRHSIDTTSTESDR